MDYIHRHWLDWSFWSMITGYLLFIPAMIWQPAWIAAIIAEVFGSCVIVFVGFLADHVVYRRMRREQER